MTASECDAVVRVLLSGFLAQGELVSRFEKAFADFIGTEHAIAVSSGTTALQLALLAHGIGSGDEVIVPAFTFVATANAVLATGAHPVMVDIDADSFNLNVSAVASAITSKTKAIIPVHLFGNPAEMPGIMDIADSSGLAVVEDAAQAHGASINGKKVGSFGTGCFSFYPTKNMTCGEGGIVTTNDAVVADHVRLLRNHGMRERYEYVSFGLNMRMSEIEAAIGLEQLDKLPGYNAQRRNNAALLTERLADVVKCPSEIPGREHVFNQYSVVVPNSRDKVKSMLRDSGVGSEIYYPEPLNKIAHLSTSGSFAVADDISQRILSLPVHPAVSEHDTEVIADAVKQAVEFLGQ